MYKNKLNHLNTALIFSFIFGLIHGLGFSNYFKMLLDEDDNKLIPLLEFSLGIELAQIVVVTCLLLLHYVFVTVFNLKRKYWIVIITLILLSIILPMTYSRL